METAKPASKQDTSTNSYIRIMGSLPNQEFSSPPAKKQRTLSIDVDNPPIDNSTNPPQSTALTPEEVDDLFAGYSPCGLSLAGK